MKISGAKVFDLYGGFTERDIYIKDGRFSEQLADATTVDARGCYAVPGLIDIHFHGCVGYDFVEADTSEMVIMAEYLAANGITAICPATVTLPEANLAEACTRMAQFAAINNNKTAQLIGINIEGPFISQEKIGAQNPKYVAAPDADFFRRLQKEAGGLIKLLDLAPEIEGALDTITELSGEVACSLAHSAATYETAMEAFARGARHVTHLYNAMPPFNHREPGIIGAACDTPSCMAELITDNVHIHPAVVRATFKMLGDDRLVLISDSMMAAGLKDGIYELGGQEVQVAGNTARLTRNGTIAGSVTNLMNCLRTAVKVMGIPLYSAVKCASVNPAKAIGLFDDRGSIETGKVADLILLDESLAIKQVFLRGNPLL